MTSPTPAVRMVSDARCAVMVATLATLALNDGAYIVRMG